MDLCHIFVKNISGQDLIKNVTTATKMSHLKFKTISRNKFNRLRNCALNARLIIRTNKLNVKTQSVITNKNGWLCFIY